MALNESPLIRSEAPNVAASGRVEHPGVLQTSRRSLIEADEERVDHEEHSATTARGVLTSRVSATGKVGEYAGLELLDWYARGDATARVEHLHDISAEMQAAPGARRLRTSAGERGERTVKVKLPEGTMTIVPKQNVDIFAAPEEQFRRRDATFPTQLKWHDYTGGHRGLPETGGAHKFRPALEPATRNDFAGTLSLDHRRPQSVHSARHPAIGGEAPAQRRATLTLKRGHVTTESEPGRGMRLIVTGDEAGAPGDLTGRPRVESSRAWRAPSARLTTEYGGTRAERVPSRGAVVAALRTGPVGMLREQQRERQGIKATLLRPGFEARQSFAHVSQHTWGLAEAREAQSVSAQLRRQNRARSFRGVGNPLTWQTPRGPAREPGAPLAAARAARAAERRADQPQRRGRSFTARREAAGWSTPLWAGDFAEMSASTVAHDARDYAKSLIIQQASTNAELVPPRPPALHPLPLPLL